MSLWGTILEFISPDRVSLTQAAAAGQNEERIAAVTIAAVGARGAQASSFAEIGGAQSGLPAPPGVAPA